MDVIDAMGPREWVIGAAEAVSVLCLLHLWRRPARWTQKLVWTAVLIAPVLGPIFYAALFGGLKPNTEHATETPHTRGINSHDHLP